MKDIEIKEVVLSDLEQLQQIARQTFVESFGDQNSDLEMQRYLDQNLSIESLESEFVQNESVFYLIAKQGVVFGYLKLNFNLNHQKEREVGCIEIERIYLLCNWQNLGIGQTVLDFVFELAQFSNTRSIWLGVWENNLGAIRFYQKNGFERVGEHVFWLGNDPQTDWLMEKVLN